MYGRKYWGALRATFAAPVGAWHHAIVKELKHKKSES